ncbi:hypothetical protein AVEN_236099-1 [Araneus ventricosus]|uniref:Uncharacterized protein n=1 Tax=Araneus ventricosus TaxID=182803 RepID=A0A4Y2HJR3_ARAVE|nr:hypothetical protein AVEN_236099-1 [Araneus ventricosus]
MCDKKNASSEATLRSFCVIPFCPPALVLPKDSNRIYVRNKWTSCVIDVLCCLTTHNSEGFFLLLRNEIVENSIVLRYLVADDNNSRSDEMRFHCWRSLIERNDPHKLDTPVLACSFWYHSFVIQESEIL